jgi:hypothetical protein
LLLESLLRAVVLAVLAEVEEVATCHLGEVEAKAEVQTEA